MDTGSVFTSPVSFPREGLAAYMSWMNEWIFYSSTEIQYSTNSKEQKCVDWIERLKEHLRSITTALKDTLMKKHTALKQNIKNNTCTEFRRDIKALTLLADTTSSGNLFYSWTTRTERKFWRAVTLCLVILRVKGYCSRGQYTYVSRTFLRMSSFSYVSSSLLIFSSWPFTAFCHLSIGGDSPSTQRSHTPLYVYSIDVKNVQIKI